MFLPLAVRAVDDQHHPKAYKNMVCFVYENPEPYHSGNTKGINIASSTPLLNRFLKSNELAEVSSVSLS